MKSNKYTRLTEAFDERKWDKGTVKFKSSSFADPHIQKVIKVVAKHKNISEADVIATIQAGMDKLDDIAAKAPILYSTIIQNKVESTLFNMVQEIGHGKSIEGAPTFDKGIFYELVRYIKAEHDQFLPLRSFINPKRLYQPMIKVLDDEEIADQIEAIQKKNGGKVDDASKDKIRQQMGEFYQISTAAASPKGEFYFNRAFMQALMNYSHLIGLQPKGKKYEHAGGDIPDEYGWIEFVIIHELMHYSMDDFHYQHLIPKANPTIINWVGDFRTNYLLVKSGYSQLPMGLFNDSINYDRQKTYDEMYNLVASEMAKLDKGQQAALKGEMDKQTDDHDPGQEEGQKDPTKSTGPKPPPPPSDDEDDEPKEKVPYYVEDNDGNLTINGRDIFGKRTPNQTVAGNIRIGHKDKFTEVEVQPGQEVLIFEKKDYRIDADGNIVVRVRKQKGVQP